MRRETRKEQEYENFRRYKETEERGEDEEREEE